MMLNLELENPKCEIELTIVLYGEFINCASVSPYFTVNDIKRWMNVSEKDAMSVINIWLAADLIILGSDSSTLIHPNWYKGNVQSTRRINEALRKVKS